MIISVSMFLRAPFDDASLAVVDEVLAKHALELKRTRKGRYWTFPLDGWECSALASPIDEMLGQVEDELLDFELLPEDAPLYLNIQTVKGNDEAFPLFTAIADELCERLGGKRTECLLG